MILPIIPVIGRSTAFLVITYNLALILLLFLLTSSTTYSVSLFFILSFCTLFIYFRLADKFKIVDAPNSRSSHSFPTVRGGGIVFPIIWFIWFFTSGFSLPFLTIGLVLVAVLGFWDDLNELKPTVRLLGQFTAFLLLWYQIMGNSNWSLWLIPIAIVSIGAINAVNFMDGINGMTGLYALSILIPIQLRYAPTILPITPWLCLIIAIMVFGWFNFRKQALCFAGDVGSLSLGYILVFYILSLMFGKNPLTLNDSHQVEFHFAYILLLSLYGFDVILTLFQRLFAGQRLFSAHRMHLYQILVNERKIPHLIVSSLYAIIQLLFSIWVLWFTPSSWITLLVIALLTPAYLCIKYAVSPKA